VVQIMLGMTTSTIHRLRVATAQNLGIVKILILVDHHDVLDPSVYAEAATISLPARGGFLDLDVGVKAATS
jgi:hypothetical protein